MPGVWAHSIAGNVLALLYRRGIGTFQGRWDGDEPLREAGVDGVLRWYLFDGASWSEFDPAEGHALDIAAPWLSISIFDSDIAIVRYEPPGPGSGVAYFGYTPQAYFENESASAPADAAREAAGLASWLTRPQGRTDEAALRELITPFIADDTQEQLDEDDEDLLDYDPDDLDDAGIFVEAKVAGFLRSVGLPIPVGWPRA